jgi:hypothetical protein
MRQAGFAARTQSPVWDSRQHGTMEDVAVLIFLTTCENCSLSGGRRTNYVVNQMRNYFCMG